MSNREKLIELFKTLLNSWAISPESAADFFLSNGVTVQEPIYTNADRIRSMSDEELARYLAILMIDTRKGVAYSTDEDRWFNWLQLPAEECE